MKLFMFYVGGNAGKSNIEVHDVQFVAVNTPEEAWPLLRDAWFGDKDKIHVDGYADINWADGFDISLSKEQSDSEYKLYFINVGGYISSTLAELHEFDLFVAKNAQEAKQKAISQLLVNSQQQHKDNLKDVDDCLLLQKIGEYYIHLNKNKNGSKYQALWQGYLPIGINS
ncbi:DUF1543 domain-containing protein [Providencia sp. wls1943]|uniref:DUF1543 domain-containing protein n=1 Tax=unclassified Providencia TaxID=2633465 RepID=UPI0012B617C4|nr:MULTISPECIES: DUF1543 domain-containing protein [unclassified Providencia]MTB66012.1 DUF1543 domain-containing protein [Providencia sp. wls1943]